MVWIDFVFSQMDLLNIPDMHVHVLQHGGLFRISLSVMIKGEVSWIVFSYLNLSFLFSMPMKRALFLVTRQWLELNDLPILWQRQMFPVLVRFR